MNRIAEGDWKTFKKVRATALERFSQRILAQAQEICRDESKTAHERYSELYEHLQSRDEEMAKAFNDFRRSTAVFCLIQMQSLGLLTETELQQFSPEVRRMLDEFA